MVPHRRHNLAASRRRAEDEGEDDAGPDTAEVEDDSLSDASAPSDLEDEDAEVEGSEISEQDEVDSKAAVAAKPLTNGHAPAGAPTSQDESIEVAGNPVIVVGRSDTQAMMNGLAVPSSTQESDEIRFEDMTQEATDPPSPASATAADASVPVNNDAAPSSESPHERRRREQEEYQKKRDADPTFVPNRGGFFMHDHRHAGPAANGFRPFGRGRGRGRGSVGGPYSPANHAPPMHEPADSPWSHDLHETVAQPTSHLAPASTGTNGKGKGGAKAAAPVRSFSKSTHIGNVQIRVYLTGMPAPITFSAVPVKQHTRLPNHRPPLRRDKAVRVSLPDAPPRYIFPSVERSFIFIPRAMRPNHDKFGRHGGRGGVGSYRGFSSRRNSVYGGSGYSSSLAMSRRSSLAQDVPRESLVSPTGSTRSRLPGGPDGGRPVVRLPPSAYVPQPSPTGAMPGRPGGPMLMPMPVPMPMPMPMPVAVVNLPRRHGYPPPQDPTYRENRAAPIPMHQPRPQKAVSVADIESPDGVSFAPPPQQQQQPFHHQVPGQVGGPTVPTEAAYYTHSRHPSYPSQPSSGTPLSQIPERAIHAQPFQPHPYQHPYYPPAYQPMLAPGAYYYPAPAPAPAPGQHAPAYGAAIPASAVAAPTFVSNPLQSGYVLPVAPTASTAPASTVPQPTGQGNTVAQESNGMVYYYDSSQLPANAAGTSLVGPPPPGSAGVVVGMGGMITPSPDGYYYPQAAPATMYYGQ
ncbi:MAG: hypothetical protein M1838_003798 [Thelocarpon superellum]|nr:MAG: hypothetical protein M1838_003798 [Thelocarpon superellum]